jgi:PPOX class probable F420-dependent enzyme
MRPAASATNAVILTLRAVMGSSASVAELPAWARALLLKEPIARLGLIDDDGAPRVLPVTFALAGGALVSAIDHKHKVVAGERLARVRWLRARPQAALTIDHYDADWSRLAWVQALGEVTVSDAHSVPESIAALRTRYQQYEQLPPAGPVLVLTPRRLLWWRASE